MKTRHNALSLVLLSAFAIACDSPPPPELFFEYDFSDDAYADEVLDVCWLAGPSETLVLAKLTADPVYYPPGDCKTQDPYKTGYAILELAPSRTAGPQSVEGTIPVVAPYGWNPGVLDLQTGDEILASFRVSRSEAILMAFISVDVSTDSDAVTSEPNPRVALPKTWSELEASAIPTQANHETLCPNVFSEGPSTSRRMTQAEYDVWVRTAEKTCPEDLPEEPSNPEPGTVEID